MGEFILEKIIKEIKQFLKKLNNDNIEEYTGETSFFMILSIIPFFMLLFSLFQFTSVDKQSMHYIMIDIVPTSLISFFGSIVEEVYSKSFSTISISALVTIWLAGRGFYSMCKGFKSIYKSDNKNDTNKLFIRIESLIFTVILIFTLVLVMIIMVFDRKINDMLKENFKTANYLTKFVINYKFIFVIIGLFLFFLYLYKLIANRKMKVKKHIPGAIFTAIGWYIITKFFSYYVDIFTGFTNMYGSLSTLILIMMWVYSCIKLIFLGAEFNSII